MNIIHIHLILNHVPIFTTFFSLLFLIIGTYFNKKQLYNIGLIGFIIGAVTVIFVFLSGQSSEEIVESIQGISKNFLDEHEEFAEVSLWLTLTLGISAIIGFFKERMSSTLSRLYIAILLIFGVITAGSLSYTAYLGGNIRHTELHQTTGQTSPANIPSNDDDFF